MPGLRSWKRVRTPSRLGDLKRLHDFLKSKNPSAAGRAISTIRTGLKILGEHPEAGRKVDGEGATPLREWIISFGQSCYVVLYRVLPQSVIILAVRHMSEAGY